MKNNFRSLNSCFTCLVGGTLLALLSGCVDNSNSVGSISDAQGGSTSHLPTSSAGAGGKSNATASAAEKGGSGNGGSGAGGPSSSSTANAGSPSSSTSSAPSSSTEVVVATATQQLLHSDLPHNTSPTVDESQYQAFISGMNGLGLELFRSKAAAKEENTVISPVSLGVALSMAYAGARGTTATEMKSVLHDSFADLTYHHAVNRLMLDLRARNLASASTDRPQSVELSLVDTWFLQRDFAVYKSYLDLLSTEYDAGVHLTDFAHNLPDAYAQINQFASNETKGKITDLLRDGDIDGLTRVVLINALYLNATWKDPFDAKETGNADFTLASSGTAAVPMMHATRTMGYQLGANYEVVKLPYIGDSLSMLLVLPKPSEFANVRSVMDEAWLRDVNQAVTQKIIDLSLPKFRLTWGTEEFNSELIEMGMPTAFNPQEADFTGICGKSVNDTVYIYKVLQKDFVGIDEAGTEAAAVSAVVLGWKSAPTVEAKVAFNRPFLFSILDKSGAVLFVGQVMDPR